MIHCEICQQSPATTFMVVRQTKPLGGERVAKAHVCLACFEVVQTDELPPDQTRNGGPLRVESVSAQDYQEIIESNNLTQ